MVFNRQIVKDNFERDVRAKIVETQQLLRQLKTAVVTVENNISLAKGDVKHAVETITQQLTNRQVELTKQIDLLSQSQIKSLQERIHSACVTLGSLQSTLNNLDSFDFSHINSLVEPNVPWPQNVSVSLLKAEVRSNSLAEEVKKWGNVNSKGLEHLTEQGCSSSSSPIQQMDFARDPETASNKSFGCRATLAKTASAKSANPNCNREPRDSQIEQWLCGMNIHSLSTESDDFEMLPDVEQQGKENNNQTCSPIGNTCGGDILVVVDKGSCCGDGGGEDGSSIMCVESDEMISSPMTTEEMSKWLKPKKSKNVVAKMADSDDNNFKISKLHSISNATLQTYLSKSTKCNPLDFPCLRLDPNAWVPKRQRNMVTATNVKRPELCLQMGQNEIIPPTYALPYPFWLKKY